MPEESNAVKVDVVDEVDSAGCLLRHAAIIIGLER